MVEVVPVSILDEPARERRVIPWGFMDEGGRWMDGGWMMDDARKRG